MNSKLLIVVPTYNEASNIVQLAQKLLELEADADILVVDDGSPDGTGARIRDLHAKEPRVSILERTGKGGRGSAVLAGFQWGLEKTYEEFIEMDADFSHRPEEIHEMRSKIKGADMVVGSRYLEGSEIHDWGMKRTVFSYIANLFARCMLGIPMSDYTNGFRLYSRTAVEAIDREHIDAKGYVVLSEVAMQLHLQGKIIREIPTIFVNRRRGISNLSFREIKEAFRSILRIFWTYRVHRRR